MAIVADRRAVLKAGALIAAPMLNVGEHAVFARSTARYSTRSVDIMKRALIIDMLAPLTLDFSPERWAERLTQAQADKYRSSGVTAFHHSVSTSGPDVYAQTLHYMAAWNGFIARNDDRFLLVDKAGDIARAKAAGKIAVIMGIQNAEHFRTAEDVGTFWRLGQRCSQLTYNSQNFIGSGSTDLVDGGLSEFGVSIVKAMNATRMLVDISHCGDRTTLDAIEASTGPVAITHSNCRALNNHPRLKTDEAIRRLVAKGGVMGITGVRNFVSAREPTTVDDFLAHIDHVARLVGVEHVGIGSDTDLDGYDKMKPEYARMLRAGQRSSYAFREKMDIEGFTGPQKYFDLTEALLRKGHSDADILGILGGNFQRLLKQVWA